MSIKDCERCSKLSERELERLRELHDKHHVSYGGTLETCGVLHSHIIPCNIAHP